MPKFILKGNMSNVYKKTIKPMILKDIPLMPFLEKKITMENIAVP